MKATEFIERVTNSKASNKIEEILTSPFFALVTAVITLLGSLFGLELVTIWYMCICGFAIMLCCKDISPVFCLLLFMNIMISIKHCPSWWVKSDYFTRPYVLAVAGVAIAIFAIGIIYRLADSIVRRRFRLTPIFWGVCAFAVAMLLNGVFYTHYYYMNFLYALGLSAILIVVFVLVSGNVAPDKNTYKNIAFYFVALCATLTIQLAVAYSAEGVIADGTINRGLIKYGWGTHNQFGFLITLCVPSWFYLATKYKHGWAFLIGGAFNFVVSIVCMSRQAMVMSAVLLLICCVLYLIVSKKRDKIIGGAMMGGVILIGIIVCIIMRDKLSELFSSLSDSLDTGSGRTELWKQGLKNWMHQPLFGIGFYDPTAPLGHVGHFGEELSSSIPRMCHNTIIQLVSSCGTVGLATYLIHRVQTVISLFKNLTAERVFIALTLGGIILTCLLDNHIFYFMPTLIYTVLLAFLAVTEKKVKEEKGAVQSENSDGALQTEGSSVQAEAE
ncbi:MAG: O-antigen ligase family protein [Candidatus Coproplasma sp.]